MREWLKGKKVVLGAGAVILALAAGGAAIAGSEDGGENQTGPEADKASAAALKITGGGTANAVERDDENGATWEVEVTKQNGDTVDVRLDQNYKLVVVESDREDAPGDDDGSGDD